MGHRPRKRIPVAATALVSLLLSMAAVYGQIGGGSVVGSVTDDSGAAVANGKVTIVNTATNTASETISNDSGYFEFPLLPPGPYVIRVSASGFAETKTNEFVLNSGTRPRFDLRLGITAVTEQISVSAQAPLVNATSTELGVVVDQRKISNLPLNGRNYQQLVSLEPGVVNKPPTQQGGRGGVEFNGASSFGNNLMLDGIDVSFGEHNGAGQDTGLSGGSVINSVSIDALEEFKTSTSAFSAEYGRSVGGVINLITKSGTNAWHGTLFEFFRNDKLDANTFDANRKNLGKPPLRYNQFGGNLGGPLKKNKLFGFFNFEELRRTLGLTQSGTTATPLLLSSVTPTMQQHLQGLTQVCTAPIANNPYLCTHTENNVRTNEEYAYLARGDYHFTDNNRIALRWNHLDQTFDQPGSTIRPANRQRFPVKTQNVMLQDSWTLTPNLFNEFRAGFSRFFLDRFNATIATEPAWVEVPSAGFASDTESRLRSTSNTYQIADNMTWIHGAHTLKFGFDIRDLRNARTQATNPTHYYASVADLIADKPINVRISPGNPGRGFRSTQYGFYVQDEWKASRRLQINTGLRYEYFTPLRGPYSYATSDFFGPMLSQRNTPLWQPDRNNFGPHLGIVYDLTGANKTILRAGGAILYVPQQPFFYYDFSQVSPLVPFSAFVTQQDIPPSIGLSVNFPFPQSYINAVGANPALLPAGLILGRNGVDPNRRDEYDGQWNLAIQHQIRQGWAVQGAYAGSVGIHELITTQQNLYLPGTTTRINPSIGQVTYNVGAGRHHYHSMQLSTNYRSGHGTADLFYTWAKNLTYGASDNSEGPRNGDIQDFQNIANSVGPKAGDLRHHLVAVYTYEVAAPFARSNWSKNVFQGWNVQGIIDWRTGFPGNVISNLDTPRNGQASPFGYRPDVVGGQPLYANGLSVPAGAAYQFYTKYWINPDAFDIVGPYQQRRFGNAGYNLIYGPHSWSFDASLIKTFRITETHRIEFRSEFFNLLNHPNDNGPDLNAYSGRFDANGLPIKNPTFGLITGKSGNRNIQFALKYRF